MMRSAPGPAADLLPADRGGSAKRSPLPAPRRAVAVTAVAVLALTAGCATYVASNLALRDELRAGRWERALGTVERSRKGADRLLRLLQRGHVLHYAGRFEESNAAFQEAEDLASSLYTRSVSQAALSVIVNDTTVDYRGQPFELAMVPYYRAFNYLSLGDLQGAQVEGRKAVLGLAGAVEATLAELEGDDARSVARRLADDGFLHWFSGLLFEADGARNDAFVAYRNAASAYLAQRELLGIAPPPVLGEDIERVGRAIGFGDEIAALRERAPGLFEGDGARPEGDGEVVLLLETGWIAHRDQVMLNVPIFDVDRRYRSRDDWAESLVVRAGPGWVRPASVSVEYWLTVAIPQMAPSDSGPVRGVRLSAAGRTAAQVPVDDLSRRAVAYYEATRGRILFRTFVRALAKYAATRAAEQEDEVAGALVNLFGVLTETADTRCWLTLPDRLAMARLSLPEGDHDLRIEYLDHAGRTIADEILPVDVRSGEWVFLNRRPFAGG